MYRCQVSGPQSSASPHPQPTITWYKDGHVLSAAGRISITGKIFKLCILMLILVEFIVTGFFYFIFAVGLCYFIKLVTE